MPEDTRTRPIGVLVTIDKIYELLLGIDTKIDDEIKVMRKEFDLEIKDVRKSIATLWKTVGSLLGTNGISIAVIVWLVQKGLSNE